MPAWLPGSGLIREHYEYASWCTDAPGIYHVASILSAIAAVSADSADLVISGDHHPLNIWTMLVGRSSMDRKTTSTRLAVDRIRPTAPKRVQSIYGSPEGLLNNLSQQSCAMLYIPEGAAFFEQREASYWRHAKGALMDLYDWTPELRRTLAKSEIVIRNPRVSILAACASALLEHYTKMTDWLGGFLPRFLLIAGQRGAEKPNTRADRQVEGHIESLLYRIYNTRWGTMSLSSGAMRVLQEFSTEISSNAESFPPGIHPALARLPEAAIRLSALYEIGSCDPTRVRTGPNSVLLVSPTSARHAVALARASRDNALAPLAELTVQAGPARELLRIEAIIRQAGIGGIRRAQLVRHSHMYAKDLDKVLETLQQQEVLNLRTVRQGEGVAGRPQWVYTHTEAKADVLRQAQEVTPEGEIKPWICVEGADEHVLTGLAPLDLEVDDCEEDDSPLN